jgi:hypothetical protein
MRQRRVAAGNGLSTGQSTTAKYVRRSCSSAECFSPLYLLISFAHLPDDLLLMRQRRVAASNERA